MEDHKIIIMRHVSRVGTHPSNYLFDDQAKPSSEIEEEGVIELGSFEF